MAFTKITGPGIHTLTNIVSHNVKSSGIITAVNGNLNGWLAVGSTASFSGNVSIGGTLTYDDVTNVDSVGVITARNGIDCNGDLDVSGISTFTNEIVIRDDSPTITFDQTSGNLPNNQYRIRQASGELVVQVSSNNGASYSNGVSIGGIGNIFIPDNDKVFFGTNDDAYIQHDNSNLNVINTTGNIDVTGNVVLNNDLKVGTGVTALTNGNVSIGGTLELFNTTGDALNNPSEIKISSLTISQHQNTGTYKVQNSNATGSLLLSAGGSGFGGIQFWNGNFSRQYFIAQDQGSIQLFHNNTVRFETSGIGATVFGELDVTGKVGIGTTDPTGAQKLHVYADSSGTGGIVQITQSGSGDAALDFQIKGEREYSLGIDNSDANKFKLSSTAGVDSDTILTATTDGKIGIGLQNPSYKLHVYGGNVRFTQPAGTDATLDINEASTTNPLRLMQTETEARIQTNASQPLNIRAQGGTGSTSYLAFWTRNSERLRITAPGNIGIGTSSPSGILHTYVDNATQRSYFQSSHGHSFIRTLAKSTNENSGLEFYSGSSNIANITGIGTGGLLFEVGGSQRARINSGDFAGITANGSFYHEEAGQTNGGQSQDKTIEFNRRGVFLMLISYSLGTTTTDINRNVYSLGLFVSRSNGATWVPVKEDLNSTQVGNLTISDGGARGKLRVQKSSGTDSRQCAFRIDVLSTADVAITVTDT